MESLLTSDDVCAAMAEARTFTDTQIDGAIRRELGLIDRAQPFAPVTRQNAIDRLWVLEEERALRDLLLHEQNAERLAVHRLTEAALEMALRAQASHVAQLDRTSFEVWEPQLSLLEHMEAEARYRAACAVVALERIAVRPILLEPPIRLISLDSTG